MSFKSKKQGNSYQDYDGRCGVFSENDEEDDGAIFYQKDIDKDSCFNDCKQAKITNCKYSNSGNCTYQLVIPDLNARSQSYDCMLVNTGMGIRVFILQGSYT